MAGTNHYRDQRGGQHYQHKPNITTTNIQPQETKTNITASSLVPQSTHSTTIRATTMDDFDAFIKYVDTMDEPGEVTVRRNYY
jgi:hypothetical protein